MQKLFDVIIPIRSKSKELKNKNILPFSGKTILVNYTIKKLLNIKEIRRIYVLTDSAKYKKKLIKHKKIDSSYLRKKKFSKANSKINDLIKDFILLVLAILPITTGRSYSILKYSFLLGVSFLVVPIQK